MPLHSPPVPLSHPCPPLVAHRSGVLFSRFSLFSLVCLGRHSSGKSVHWDDDEAAAADFHGEQSMGAEDGQPRLPASQQWLYRAMMAVSYATEYGGSALKWGWMPTVLFLGLSNVYCTSSQRPFAHLMPATQ